MLALSLLFSLLRVESGWGQYCNTATSNDLITPTATAQLTTSYNSGRRAFNFTATAGCKYVFSTCSQSTSDTYLGLYSTASGGTLLAGNDDFCSAQSQITWTCPSNGAYSILLTRYTFSAGVCAALNNATRVSYYIAPPAQPSAIVGTLNPEPGTSQSYSVTNVTGTSYNWTFPSSWTITAGQGTNSVTVTVGTQNGTISVSPTACIAGTASTITTTIPNYRWKYISSTLGSATWTGGENRNLSLTIKNTGVGTWNSGVTTNLGVRWDSDNSAAAFAPWTDYHSRVTTGVVASGAQVTLSIPIQAKNATAGPVYGSNLADGNYYLAFDLVNEGSCWFAGPAGGAGACTVGNVSWYSVVQTISTVPTLSCTALTAFGNVCTNVTPINSFSISGVNLTNNVSIGSLAGYTYSTTSNGTYTSTLTLTPSSGTINQTVFVKFTPTAATTYNGAIVVSSTGATSQNVSASGTGVNASISSQPSSAAVTYCNGTSATALSVTVPSASGSSYSYQWYSNAANSNSGGTLITNATSASYTPPTTSNGTTYYYCVVSGCGTSTAASAVSGAINVVSCCTHTVQMYDSYGDGWNGGTMNVSVNGTVVATIGSTFTTGLGPIAATFSAPTGATISVSMNAGGSYPEERYISVISGTGATLVSNWYPNTSGTWNGTANCPPSINSFSPTNICAGGIITISGSSFSSSAVTGVTVNGVAVNSYTVVNSTTITAVTTTTQASGVVAVTYSGGSSSSSSSLTMNSLPTISSNGTVNAVCTSASSQTSTFSYSASTNAPTAYSIDWNATANSAGLADVATTSHSFLAGGSSFSVPIGASTAPGVYNGVLSFTNANGCVGTSSINITITALPTLASASQQSSLCYTQNVNTNASIQLSGLLLNTAQTATYNINGGTSQTITFTSSASGTATLSIPVTMANHNQTLTITGINCANFISNNSCVLSVIQAPSAPNVLPLTQSVNVGASATFTGLRSASTNTLTWWTAASGGTEIDPDGPALSVDSVFNSYDAVVLPSTSIDFCTPGLINASTTTYKYYVQQYDGTCPSARTLVQVFTNPLVSSSSSNNLICQTGASVTLTANVTQNSTGSLIQWTSNTNSTGSFTNLSTSNPLTVSPTISTMYQLNTSVLMPFGCNSSNFNTTIVSPSSTQQNVLVYPSLDFSPYANPDSVCIGGISSLIPNTPSGNFTASCITPISTLSIPPASAVTLVSGGTVQTLPTGLTQGGFGVDDNFISGVPIGFNYNFFNQPASTVFVGTNGTVTVNVTGAVGSSVYSFTGGFPSTANPASTIAVCARDLNLTSGSIKYWTEGFSPTRRFVVQYANCPEYSGTGTQSAELVLYETSGIIDIRVIQATNVTTWASSLAKYIGLQDPTQQIGATAPNCNSSNVTLTQNYWNGITNQITSPLAWRFAPPANYNIKWYQGTTISGPLLATTNYSSTLPASAYNYNTLSSQSGSAGQLNYTVSATNTNTNCPSAQTLPITVNALPSAPNSSGNVTACNNVTSAVLSAIPPANCTIDWYTSTGTFISSGNTLTVNPSILSVGSNTYYAKSVSSFNCSSSGSGTAVVLTVVQAPVSPTTSATLSYCQGASAVPLTATGTALTWYQGTTVLTGAPTPVTSAATTLNYSVTQTQSGCPSNPAAIAVTIVGTPSLTNSSLAQSICNGDASSAITLTSNSSGAASFAWTASASSPSVTGFTSTGSIASIPGQTIANTSTSVQTVTYAVTPSNTVGSLSCPGPVSNYVISVNPTLTASVVVNASTVSVCSGGAITFTATPTNGGTSPTYQWFLNSTTTPVPGQTSSTYTLATPASGDQVFVKMTANPAPNCLNPSTSPATSNTITLNTAPATPVVNITQSTPTTTVCSGTSVTFSVATSTALGSNPTYQWLLNGTPISGATGATFTTTTLINNNVVSLLVTSSIAANCLTQTTATSAGISMTVTPLTTITTQPIGASVCQGATPVLSSTASGTGTLTYQWQSCTSASATTGTNLSSVSYPTA